MNMKSSAGRAALFLFVIAFARLTQAQTVYAEDFTGATTDNQWYFTNGACLTAGSSTSTTKPNSVPGCSTIWTNYYSQTHGQYSGDTAFVGGATGTGYDTVGNGALRFTNGAINTTGTNGHGENGSIVSAFTFDASQGVQITFKTATYHGDSGGANGYQEGADGLSFYLIDGSLNPNTTTPYDGTGTNLVGAWGGSLAYSCSNINNDDNTHYDGLVGAYLGLGIDEYGNFLHGATLASGYAGTNRVNPQSGAAPLMTYNSPAGDNGYAGYGYMPNRIGLRGAGSVAWAYLHKTYPTYYPSSLTSTQQANAVQNTCINGQVLDYGATHIKSGGDNCTVGNGGPGTSTSGTTGQNCPVVVPAATLTGAGLPVLRDYAPIAGAYAELGTSLKLANETLTGTQSHRPDGVNVTPVLMYNLKITQDGLLSLSYSVNGGAFTSVIKNQSITASNGALPSTLRFGFAGSTGGSTNVHEVMCFKAAPVDTSSTSATTDQLQAGKLQTTSQAYFAYYNPTNWTGRMTAYGLVNTSGTLSLNTFANWDSQCVLSGISGLYPATTTCATTGVSTPTAAQSSRTMLTWSGSAGVPFQWASSVTNAPLNLGDSKGTQRLSYLRGDRSNEINTLGVGLFRFRDGVLGDIMDSSPVYVGSPRSPYYQVWKDRLFPAAVPAENSGTSYATFASSYTSNLPTNSGRLNVLYAGANDGFVHGFRSGSEDATGNVITPTSTPVADATTPNDGAEVLAYMPSVVLNTIHSSTNSSIDYSSANYGHNFYVDASPGYGDLFYNNAWHTWLVGGLGAGGAGLYALDITNPGNFAEANAASLVIGDWSSSTITCVNVSSCGTHLGNTYGTPVIRRLHNGGWGVIFGNGFGSSAGDAGIYVMTVDTSGNKLFYYFSTNVGSSGSPNGIAYVTPADLDGDHITDYVYAGDLQGNVWRFDLTANSYTGWGVTAGPLFKTQAGQPITTPLVLAAKAVAGGTPAVIVAFGTGQRTQLTNTTPTTYASGTQSLYGIWDWNFASWNAKSPTQYASLTAGAAKTASGVSSAPYTLSYSNLQAQTFTVVNTTTPATVNTSNTAVTWPQCTSDTSCNSGAKFGWYANLPGSNGTGAYKQNEQIVSSPILFQQGLIVNSTIPGTTSPLTCANASDSGITYVVAVDDGGTFSSVSTPLFSGFLNYATSVNMVGVQTNETGALSVVTTQQSTTFLIGQAINPQPGQSPGKVIPIALPPNFTVQRTTWTQLR